LELIKEEVSGGGSKDDVQNVGVDCIGVFLDLPPFECDLGYFGVGEDCDDNVGGFISDIEELGGEVVGAEGDQESVLDGGGFFGDLLEEVEEGALF
jgi:hypothetical protein